MLGVWTEELKGMGVTIHEVDVTPFVERIAQRNQEWQADGYWPDNLIANIQSLR